MGFADTEWLGTLKVSKLHSSVRMVLICNHNRFGPNWQWLVIDQSLPASWVERIKLRLCLFEWIKANKRKWIIGYKQIDTHGNDASKWNKMIYMMCNISWCID